MRTGYRIVGRGVADGGCEHKHVSGSGNDDGQEIIFRPLRFTYEIAPIFILMEHVVLKKMREMIGFLDGDSILAPGRICRPALPLPATLFLSLSVCVPHMDLCVAVHRRCNFESVRRHDRASQAVS